MGCGTSKPKSSIIEPQKKEPSQQQEYFNDPEEKNQFIKDIVQEQEALQEQREKSRRQTKMLEEERRKSSILKSQKLDKPDNQFSEWKYLNPEPLEESGEFEKQNDETFSQFQQVRQQESRESKKFNYSQKENIVDQQYEQPRESAIEINPSLEDSQRSAYQQISQPLSEQRRIPANPRNSQIKKISNFVYNSAINTPKSSSIITPNDGNSINERNKLNSNRNSVILPRDCPKMDLDQLPHYVKSQPTMPWEDHCSVFTENLVTRLKSPNCDQNDENGFPDISRKCSQKKSNIESSINDQCPPYCETHKRVFQSRLKVQLKQKCPFSVDKAVINYDLDSLQAANLARINKLLSRNNEYIIRLIVVIYSGFILKTKSFNLDNSNSSCKNKKNSRSLKILFFSEDKSNSAQLDELMQKEVYLMERIQGKPGVVAMREYSFERIFTKTQIIGILIMTLEDEVIGTLRDMIIFHQRENNLSMNNGGSQHGTAANSMQSGIQNNMSNSTRRTQSYLSERSILKKAKELIAGMKTVFDANCYNYNLDESVILICSNTENIQLCDFGAQDFSRTYNYIFNEMSQNLVLQSPQIRVMLGNQPQGIGADQSKFLVSESNQIYSAGASLCLLAGVPEDSLIEYAASASSSFNELSQSGYFLNYQNSALTHSSYSVRILAYKSSLRESLFVNSLPGESPSSSSSKSHLLLNQLLTQSLNLSSFPLLESRENDVNYLFLCFMNIDEEERNIQSLLDIIEVLSAKYFIDYPILRLEHEYIKPPAQSRAPNAITFEDLKSRASEQNPDTHYLLALGYNKIEKNYNIALGHVLKALQLSQESEAGEYLNSLGCILLNLGKIEQAQIAFDLAMQRSPRYALPYYNSGFIKHKIERRPLEAMELYNQSIKLDEKLGEAIFNLALLLKNDLGQIDQARKKYYFYCQLFPADSQADNNIGVLEVERERLSRLQFAQQYNKRRKVVSNTHPLPDSLFKHNQKKILFFKFKYFLIIKTQHSRSEIVYCMVHRSSIINGDMGQLE